MTLPATAKTMAFIVTADRAAAKAFYEGVLGFPLVHEDEFAAVFDLNGVMLRVSSVPEHTAQAHTVLGWEVQDIARTVNALTAKGVAFVVYDGFGQDASGVWSPLGGTTKIAWFKDPGGNLLSLTQF